jgi:transposase-like protein
MAKLVLTEEEAETLRDTLDIDIEAWEDELEKICLQPVDSWDELLQNSAFSAEMIKTLTRLREQLND